MHQQRGFSYIESLIIFPAMLLLCSILFVIPIVHIHRWNQIFAEEELYYCLRYLTQSDCKSRADRLKKALEILNLSDQKIYLK